MTLFKKLFTLTLILILSACGGGGSSSSSSNDSSSIKKLQSISMELPAKLANGKNVAVKVTGNYSDGSTSDLTSSVSFTSSDSNTGYTIAQSFYAKRIGSVTVTATYLIDYKTTATVEVTAAEPESLVLSGYIDGLNTYSLRDSRQLTALVRYTDYSEVKPTGTVTWSSSDTAVASVDSTGNVLPLKTGTTTITAQADGFKSTKSLTFIQPLDTPVITLNCDGNDAVSANSWNTQISNDNNNTKEWFKFGSGCIQYPIIKLFVQSSAGSIFYTSLASAARRSDAQGFVPATTFTSDVSTLKSGTTLTLGYKNLETDSTFTEIKTFTVSP